ncbi:IS1096 element passenger TnpR family protein [Pasteurella atlantica]
MCTKGERACPPEDCGGPMGYDELLDILSDKKHPSYDDMIS